MDTNSITVCLTALVGSRVAQLSNTHDCQMEHPKVECWRDVSLHMITFPGFLWILEFLGLRSSWKPSSRILFCWEHPHQSSGCIYSSGKASRDKVLPSPLTTLIYRPGKQFPPCVCISVLKQAKHSLSWRTRRNAGWPLPWSGSAGTSQLFSWNVANQIILYPDCPRPEFQGYYSSAVWKTLFFQERHARTITG